MAVLPEQKFSPTFSDRKKIAFLENNDTSCFSKISENFNNIFSKFATPTLEIIR